MKLTAKKRGTLGKKVKKLREQGLLPAVVFGKEIKSIPITLDHKEFEKVYEEAGESTLIDVVLSEDGRPEQGRGGQLHKVLISEVDTDPVTDEIIHTNLQAVSLTEKTTAAIALKIVGESPIVKSGKGMLLTLLNEVEVEALPQDLPPEIKVDISGLTELDQGIAVKDLPVDHSKVEIKQDAEDLVVKVEHAEMEEEEEAKEEVPIEEAVKITKEKPATAEGAEESAEDTKK